MLNYKNIELKPGQYSQIQRKLHFYYCAYVALRFASIYANATTQKGKTVYIQKWMDVSLKKKTFGKSGASEIAWLRSIIKKYGLDFNVEKLILHVYLTASSIINDSP